VKAASATVSDELTLTNGASFFRTWQGSLVCERGNAQFVLGSGGYHTATAYVVGEDGEAFVDIRRNTVRLSENTRYIRTENFIDAWKNGYSSARQGVSNLLSFGLGTVGLRPPYILQCFSFNNSIGSFYDALRKDRAPVIGGPEGAAVVEACEAVVNSAATFRANAEMGVSVNG